MKREKIIIIVAVVALLIIAIAALVLIYNNLNVTGNATKFLGLGCTDTDNIAGNTLVSFKVPGYTYTDDNPEDKVYDYCRSDGKLAESYCQIGNRIGVVNCATKFGKDWRCVSASDGSLSARCASSVVTTFSSPRAGSSVNCVSGTRVNITRSSLNAPEGAYVRCIKDSAA